MPEWNDNVILLSSKPHGETGMLTSVFSKYNGRYKAFVYGNYIKETFNYLSKEKKGKVFKNLDEAYNHFSKILHNNDILMVKGSNATGLNQFSKNFKKGKISAI